MGEKTAGVGHFAIPTAPAAGVSVTSGATNVFTTTYVALSASAPAALFITGLYVEQAAVTAATYIVVQLATGTAGSETVVGQHLIAPVTGSTVARAYKPIYPPIPIANATRIAAKTADSVGALASLITLECINQSNVVDDGVAVGTVTTVTNQLTAAQIATGVWQDATAGDFTTASSIGKSLYTTGATPGATGGLFIAGTNAATTVTTSFTTTFTGNLTGSVGSVTGAVGSVTGAVGSVTGAVGSVTGAVGSVTGNVGGNVVGSVASVTAAVTLPSIPANWITAAGITAAALNGKGDWNIGKTGYSLTTADWAKAGDAMTLTAAYDAAKTALASSSYTAPDNTSITAIKAKTDSLTFTVANKLDGNIRAVNGVTVTGTGATGTTWGP